MFSIITRIEATPFQTMGTCPEVRRVEGGWGGPRQLQRSITDPAVFALEHEGPRCHLPFG